MQESRLVPDKRHGEKASGGGALHPLYRPGWFDWTNTSPLPGIMRSPGETQDRVWGREGLFTIHLTSSLPVPTFTIASRTPSYQDDTLVNFTKR